MNFGSLLNFLTALAYNQNAESDNSIAVGPGYNLGDSSMGPRKNATIIIEFEKYIPIGASNDNQQSDESIESSNEDVGLHFIDLTPMFKPIEDVKPDYSGNNERFIDLTQVLPPMVEQKPAHDGPTIEFIQENSDDEKAKIISQFVDLTTVLDKDGKPISVENNQNAAVESSPEPSESPAKVEAIQLTQREKDAKSALEEALESMEKTMLERLHEVYVALAKYNSFSYTKNQEIQYMSYSQHKKQDIMDEQNVLKDEIRRIYNEKLIPTVGATERLRSKLLLWDPEASKNIPYSAPWSPYWPESNPIPESWILLYNLETILMQLYTPKPAILTTFDDREKTIHLRRKPIDREDPRGFISLPTHDSNGKHEPIDHLFDIQNNHDIKKLNSEQETFSQDKLEQQILVYYTFKYFEYKASDLDREIKWIVTKLEQLEKYGQTDKLEFQDLKKRLPNRLAELQYATEQMQIYRTIPELVSIFNAETMARKYVLNSKFITELKGSKKNNVQLRSLQELQDDDDDDDDSIEEDHEKIDDPLEWDKNWSWDF